MIDALLVGLGFVGIENLRVNDYGMSRIMFGLKWTDSFRR